MKRVVWDKSREHPTILRVEIETSSSRDDHWENELQPM